MDVGEGVQFGREEQIHCSSEVSTCQVPGYRRVNAQNIPVISVLGKVESGHWQVPGQLSYIVPGQPREHGETVLCACMCGGLTKILERMKRR